MATGTTGVTGPTGPNGWDQYYPGGVAQQMLDAGGVSDTGVTGVTGVTGPSGTTVRAVLGY